MLGWTVSQWHNLYHDLPSKMIKFPVSDKSLIVCNEDETRTVSPVGLQEALDAEMGAVRFGRCFVRPSGTEDVVRLYAEASCMEEVELLIAKSIEAIKRFVR